MRILLEILFLVALVSYCWNNPFRDNVRRIFPNSGIQPSRIALLEEIGKERQQQNRVSGQQPLKASSTPAQDTRWMWEKTILDQHNPKK